MRVKDKVAVVTGAAGGIGEAVARRFVQDGARGVVVADLDAGRLEAVARDIDALAVPCDIGRESEVRRLIDAARDRFGPVDIYFSNAGVLRLGHEAASDADWALNWAVHVMAHVYAARVLVPEMLARGEGYLLNTASAAGLLASMTSAPYGVTKHAAVAFAEHLAIQCGDRGIRVSVLCPQGVDTDMLRSSGSNAARADGILPASAVADCVVQAMDREEFLILPHPEVLDYLRRKTGDYGRWLKGMRKLRQPPPGDVG